MMFYSTPDRAKALTRRLACAVAGIALLAPIAATAPAAQAAPALSAGSSSASPSASPSATSTPTAEPTPTPSEARQHATTAGAKLGGSGNSSTSSKGKKAIAAAARTHKKQLGAATGSIRCGLKSGGCSRAYKNGSIYWSAKTGAHPVWKGLDSHWKKHNRERGKYGYPKADPTITSTGRWTQKFTGGTLTTGIIRKGLPHGIKPDGGRQLIIASTAKRASTRGEVQLWSLKNSGTWKRDHRFKNARYGYRGLATASAKREGDGKTPMGQYKVPFAFGKSAKPKGSKLEYRRIDRNDQWCSKSSSKHYNTWMGSPNKSCPAKGSEVLSHYPTQYAHAAVVDYNKARKKNRGSAIFLHVHGKGSTAGCVSVSKSQMARTLKWLDPKKNPRIVIAPTGELKKQ